MDIVKKIDRLRKEKGWTVNKLATESLLTQSTVSNMLKSGAEPKIATLKSICDALDISLAEFFYESESPLLTPRNLDMLSIYNNLSKEQQRIIFDLIKTLYNESKK